MTIYTLGYAQWSIEEVEETVARLDAVLVDIRHSPYTSKPGFSKDELSARFSDRYVHVDGLGNVNYKDGPVELANPEEGLAQVEALTRTPLLMCGCRNPSRCHRSEVTLRMTEGRDATVQHLSAPSERAQPDLFTSSSSDE